MYKLLGVIILAFVVSGCSSSNYVQLNKQDLYKIDSDKTRVLVYRNSSVFGIAQKPPIMLNDKYIGQSVSGTMFYKDVPRQEKNEFYIPLTKYSLVTGVFGGPNYDNKGEILTFSSIDKDMVCIKNYISLNLSGKTEFKIVDCEVAQKEINDLELVKFNTFD